MVIRLLARGVAPGNLSQGLGPTRPAVASVIAAARAALAEHDLVAAEAAHGFRPGLLPALHEAGVFRLTVPAEHGGVDATLVEYCRAMVALAEVDGALAVTAVPHLANGVKSIALFGSAPQRAEVLGDVCAGRGLVSFALTEAHTGSDVGSHRTCLRADGTGLALEGTKTWITNVPFATHIIVVAKCPELCGIKDGSAFALVRPGAPGFSVGKTWQKLALNASPTVDLYLDVVRVERDRLVGPPGAAMAQFREVVLWGRLGSAAAAVGLVLRAAAQAHEISAGDPRAERVAAALRRRALVTRAVLEVTAAACASGAAEPETATALCKAFCTVSAESAARVALALAIDGKARIPAALEYGLLEVAAFKVLEGPNELLLHAAAVDVLGSLRCAAPGSEQPEGPLAIAARRLREYAATRGPLAAAPLGAAADVVSVLWAVTCAQAFRAASPSGEARDACARFIDSASQTLTAGRTRA
jgi:alkylation response protein AidB-like acyl-CoA dehydrogenase